MIVVRKASARGHGQHGWLDTYHTFSFNDYYDPGQMGFRVLRVLNEDRVEPGRGFGMHGHRDMEIISYVLEGALGHKDSLGNGSVLRQGELQCMTAGTGIRHSEYNPSESEPVHFYQIWLLPSRPGLHPGYDQRAFPASERPGKLQVVASPDGRDGSLTINQDATVMLASLAPGQQVVHELASVRHAWLQVLRGAAQLNGQQLFASDGASVSDEKSLTLVGTESCELMLFDLP